MDMLISETNASALKRPLPKLGLFTRKPLLTENLALLLPDNPEKRARLDYKDREKSVFAQVLKGEKKTKCQDAILFSVDKEHLLIGVLDGFGVDGNHLPVIVGDNIAKYWNALKHLQMGEAGLKHIVFNAEIQSLRNSYYPGMKGGTTAVIATVSPDNRYQVASVGDSACYHIDKQGNAKRLFSNDLSVFHYGQMKIQGSAIGADPGIYARTRNFLATSISSHFDMSHIETTEGILGIGEKIILVSDGITKNMYLKLDEEGKLLDTSGCFDIERLIRGKSDAGIVADTILAMAKKRALAGEMRTRFNKDGHSILLPADDDMAVLVMGRE